ncbi:putative transcription factor [Lasiosphaeria ovina]|uniref:Transcription factor n=1 Tax=Lasiosphaeria ovina TaxID=92902 RepID=A0AAE0JYQ2_9PEZI|nr:putative transcription factor [Lasiosphaeria ovina]
MDDEYGSSDNEQDELMDEADDLEPDHDGEEENEEEDDEQDEQDEPEPEPEPEHEHEHEPEPGPEQPEPEPEPEPTEGSESQAQTAGSRPDGEQDANTADQPAAGATSTPASPLTASQWRPRLRHEYITAPLYDIVPTMAAPQATSINAIAITPDLRYWMTGGSDGYIRKYDGMGTINGKQQLTVAQKHPFVDSVVKAAILMSYWENEEPPTPNARAEERVTSPVYSLAVHSSALWLLSGLESGGINLQSVRHDEGKRIHCLRDGGHTNAVSVLQLAPDEKSVLSGSWDKSILDWDLNNGQIIRRFEGIAGQISAIELRPANGAPIPAEAGDPEIKSDTFESGNARTRPNGFFTDGLTEGTSTTVVGSDAANDGATAVGDGASPEHESLFGSPGGSLFGDNDTIGGGGNRGGGGGGAFGNDDDVDFSGGMDMGSLHEESTHHGLDNPGEFPMGDTDMSNGPGDSGMAQSFTEAGGGAPGDLSNGISNGTLSEGTVNGDIIKDTAMGFGQQSSETQNPSFLTEQAQTQEQQSADAPSQNVYQPAVAQPSMVYGSAQPPSHHDPTQSSSTTFLSTAIDGTIRIWDRRTPDPVARIGNRPGVPPWCMGACWSPDGNWIYAGRRNGTVEEFNIHNARSGWRPERVLKFPNGSGPVSTVRAMVNGRHLVCGSHDILRLYDLRENAAFKHSKVPFIIIPGPPRAGVISTLYIDPSSRIMISAAGTRGWEGTSTECLIGYEIAVAAAQ